MLEIGEDDASIETEAPLPLKIKLVLDVIFAQLPKKSWKSTRLVNKLWNSTLQRQWRDQMIYKLEKEEARDKRLYEVLEKQHPANNPNDPLQLGCHPFRNVCFGLDYRISLRSREIRFWELYGRQLKSIYLDRVNIYGALLKRLLFELTPSLEEFVYYNCLRDCESDRERNYMMYRYTMKPESVTEYTTPPGTLQKNLKCFKFENTNYTPENESFDKQKLQFPIDWTEFFSVFPNIQKLKLEFNPPKNDEQSDFLKVFEAIDLTRKEKKKKVLNITELHTDQTGFVHVDVIKNKSLFTSLPVSILKINVTKMSNTEIIFLVQTFKSTLRHFTIEDDLRINGGEYLPNDMLPQGLTKLSFRRPFFQSLEFLSYTPNLEELELGNITPMLQANVCENLADVSPLVNLKKLAYMLEDVVPRENMQILAKLMPNVENCKCSVDANGFRELCRGWANLVHLDLVFFFTSEDIFVEHIIQLTKLRLLKVECHLKCKLTDTFVFEGLLKLPSLTKVQLPKCPGVVENITEKGLQALEDKLCDDLVLNL